MKLTFGYENNGSIDKVSAELRSRGINMLKCVPSDFPAIGLVRYPQLGFGAYRSALPAFMYASDTGQRTSLYSEGYPLRIGIDKCLPFSLPPISVTFTKVPMGFDAIKAKTNVEDVSIKGKQTGFLVDPVPGLLYHILRLSPDTNSYAPVGSVGAGEYTSLVTIVRLLSSFLRTHQYPAYGTPEDFEGPPVEVETVTRNFSELKDKDSDKPLPLKRRLIEDNGLKTIITIDPESISEDVALKFAKPPGNAGIKAWGTASDIPVTHGIVIPYVPDLASWDKVTVPNLIERYFLRCLGNSTNACLHGFSKLSQDWKRSIYKTPIGNVLTHMCKTILLSLTSETRAFPIIEDGQYLGCYLSGANFSIGLKGMLIQPVSRDENDSDIASLDSHMSSLEKFAAVLTSDEDDQADCVDRSTSMRRLHEFASDKCVVDLKDDLTHLRKLRFPQPYLPITLNNVKLILVAIQNGSFDLDLPMHHSAFGSNDPFVLGLAAFGPSPPSPHIPGAPKVKFIGKTPADKDLPRLLVFRKCAMNIAVSDWKEALDSGTLGNNPTNLNARYVNIKVSGNEDKKMWYDMMKEGHKWRSSHLGGSDTKVTLGNIAVGEDVDEDDGLGTGGF